MSQMSFGDSEYASKRKRTRRETFLAEMEQIIPWTILLNLIEPVYPKAGNCRPLLLALCFDIESESVHQQGD